MPGSLFSKSVMESEELKRKLREALEKKSPSNMVKELRARIKLRKYTKDPTR